MQKNNLYYKIILLTVTLVSINIFFINKGNYNHIGYNYSPNTEHIHVENITTQIDTDVDGINDIDDILSGARAEIKNKTNYKSNYYLGGYPPNNEGVCTDVIRRALESAGIDLKSKIDKDIAENIDLYSRVGGNPDPNIDFRRVPNLKVFFDRNAISLTTELIPGNQENMSEYQPGDIVVFGKPKDHIAIISDKRNKYGVPYIIHNSAPTPREDDRLVYWHKINSPIIGHYRIDYGSF